MRTPLGILLTTVASLAIAPGFAQDKEAQDTKAVLAKLGDSKHTLLEGIAQAEKDSASKDKADKTTPLAISAKFELEDGKFNLSVYIAQKGRDQDAEHNALMELGGDPSAAGWTPETEVFADKEHLVRSASQLTLMQLTKLTLADIIGKATATTKGTVYSAIPSVKAGKPIVTVLVATPDGKSAAVNIDIQTGKVAD